MRSGLTALLFVVMAAVVNVGCPRPLPTPAIIVIEAGTPPATGDGTACPDACMNLRELNCPAGFPTKGGIGCEAICYQALSTDYMPWPAQCAISAQTKYDARACGFLCP